MKKKFVNKTFLMTSALIAPFSVIPVVVSCSADKLDGYINQINEMMKKPEELITLEIRDHNFVNNDPKTKKLKITQSELLNNSISDVFVAKPTQKWLDWNQKIENDSSLTKREKGIVKLDKHVLQNIRFPSLKNDGEKPRIGKLVINIDMSYGGNSDNIQDFIFDLDQQKITFQNSEPLKLEIKNEGINLIAKSAIDNHIRRKTITEEKAKKDRTELNFKIEEDDFEGSYSKKLWQDNMYVFLDGSEVVSNEVNLIFYFADSAINVDNDDYKVIVEKIKKQYFWIKMEGIKLHNESSN